MGRQPNQYLVRSQDTRTPRQRAIVARHVAEAIRGEIAGYFGTQAFADDLASIEPKERLDVMIKLLHEARQQPSQQPLSISIGGEKAGRLARMAASFDEAQVVQGGELSTDNPAGSGETDNFAPDDTGQADD
ncbi:MAG: hypothetical protein LUC33_04430 [Prevotellaceae bacterium]|nr:hypothetical protein [Prevotellaceae bacterium]